MQPTLDSYPSVSNFPRLFGKKTPLDILAASEGLVTSAPDIDVSILRVANQEHFPWKEHNSAH